MLENNSSKIPVPEPETHNWRVIKKLHKALACFETETVAKLLASDLEWWFHGPPHCKHMMHILTGESRPTDHFKFKPRGIKAIDDRVIVEGWEGVKAYWLHVWTLKDGIITQFREYFNTCLTVIVRVSEDGDAIRLWQSEPQVRLNHSLPDLVLAI